jgi:hypothetical protein
VKGRHYAVVYTWKDGRREVKYTRPVSDIRLARNVKDIRRQARQHGYESPYSLERIP